jgi:hypothetical protein
MCDPSGVVGVVRFIFLQICDRRQSYKLTTIFHLHLILKTNENQKRTAYIGLEVKLVND